MPQMKNRPLVITMTGDRAKITDAPRAKPEPFEDETLTLTADVPKCNPSHS
jgi:hypothetical protein